MTHVALKAFLLKQRPNMILSLPNRYALIDMLRVRMGGRSGVKSRLRFSWNQFGQQTSHSFLSQGVLDVYGLMLPNLSAGGPGTGSLSFSGKCFFLIDVSSVMLSVLFAISDVYNFELLPANVSYRRI